MSASQMPLQLFGKGRLKASVEYLIAGVDEAGRGPLAGPVVAAAVVLDPRRRLRGIRDSKEMEAAEREEMAIRIRSHALAWSVAWADVEEIDCLNILEATYLAMRRALMGLHLRPAHVEIDGNRCPSFTGLRLDCTFEAIIDGDALRASIGAASILAKVRRDEIMVGLDRLYPQYGFAGHKGYGTPQHCEMLENLGPSKIHRRSFEPVAMALRARDQAESAGQSSCYPLSAIR
ncbi:MAG TPA: ribonuclease HII [Povalibacter sp.]|nr:ribonuclease HII [Povalibacter sp.]